MSFCLYLNHHFLDLLISKMDSQVCLHCFDLTATCKKNPVHPQFYYLSISVNLRIRSWPMLHLCLLMCLTSNVWGFMIYDSRWKSKMFHNLFKFYLHSMNICLSNNVIGQHTSQGEGRQSQTLYTGAECRTGRSCQEANVHLNSGLFLMVSL